MDSRHPVVWGRGMEVKRPRSSLPRIRALPLGYQRLHLSPGSRPRPGRGHAPLRAGSGRLGAPARVGQPHRKDSFQPERAEAGRKQTCRPASGPPGPRPPAQPRRGCGNGGGQLQPPRVTPSHAGRAPRPHLGSLPRVLGPGLRGAWRGRGERPAPRGGPDPNWGPVAKKPDPRLGLRQQPGAAASPNPLHLPPPHHPERLLALRRSGDPRRRQEPWTAALWVKARRASLTAALQLRHASGTGVGPRHRQLDGLARATPPLGAAASKRGAGAEL